VRKEKDRSEQAIESGLPVKRICDDKGKNNIGKHYGNYKKEGIKKFSQYNGIGKNPFIVRKADEFGFNQGIPFCK